MDESVVLAPDIDKGSECHHVPHNTSDDISFLEFGYSFLGLRFAVTRLCAWISADGSIGFPDEVEGATRYFRVEWR